VVGFVLLSSAGLDLHCGGRRPHAGPTAVREIRVIRGRAPR
jgi:hypothetical protein